MRPKSTRKGESFITTKKHVTLVKDGNYSRFPRNFTFTFSAVENINSIKRNWTNFRPEYTAKTCYVSIVLQQKCWEARMMTQRGYMINKLG